MIKLSIILLLLTLTHSQQSQPLQLQSLPNNPTTQQILQFKPKNVQKIQYKGQQTFNYQDDSDRQRQQKERQNNKGIDSVGEFDRQDVEEVSMEEVGKVGQQGPIADGKDIQEKPITEKQHSGAQPQQINSQELPNTISNLTNQLNTTKEVNNTIPTQQFIKTTQQQNKATQQVSNNKTASNQSNTDQPNNQTSNKQPQRKQNLTPFTKPIQPFPNKTTQTNSSQNFSQNLTNLQLLSLRNQLNFMNQSLMEKQKQIKGKDQTIKQIMNKIKEDQLKIGLVLGMKEKEIREIRQEIDNLRKIDNDKEQDLKIRQQNVTKTQLQNHQKQEQLKGMEKSLSDKQSRLQSQENNLITRQAVLNKTKAQQNKSQQAKISQLISQKNNLLSQIKQIQQQKQRLQVLTSKLVDQNKILIQDSPQPQPLTTSLSPSDKTLLQSILSQLQSLPTQPIKTISTTPLNLTSITTQLANIQQSVNINNQAIRKHQVLDGERMERDVRIQGFIKDGGRAGLRGTVNDQQHNVNGGLLSTTQNQPNTQFKTQQQNNPQPQSQWLTKDTNGIKLDLYLDYTSIFIIIAIIISLALFVCVSCLCKIKKRKISMQKSTNKLSQEQFSEWQG